MINTIILGIRQFTSRLFHEERADEVFGKAALIAILAIALIAFMVLMAAVAGAFESATQWLQ